MNPDRLCLALLGALFVTLPLGTFASELATGLALALALVFGERRRLGMALIPLSGLALAFALAAPGGGVLAWREVAGRVWPLVPLAIIPALARQRDPRIETLGLVAAALVGAWGLVERLGTGAELARGPFSHHLTLGYALVPPLGLALARRRGLLALLLLGGILAAGGSGPVLSAAVLGLGLVLAPLPALGLGLLTALGLIAALGGQDELQQRGVLWSSGAWLAVQEPLGTGPTAFREEVAVVQQALQPGFFFPLHAHDSALQLSALVGLGGLIALAWIALELWRAGDRPGRAILAGLAAGALTQDLLGDLEVARAAAAWLAWCALAEPLPPAAVPGAPPPRLPPRLPPQE